MRTNFRILAARVLILTVIALPILFGGIPLIFLKNHEYLLSAAALLYILPLYIAVLFGIAPLVKLFRIVKSHGLEEAQRRMTAWTEGVRLKAPSDDEYSEARSRFWRSTIWALSPLYGLFVLPGIILKAVLGVRLGVRVAWWPDFQPVIVVLFTWLSYVIAGAGHPAVGLVLGIYLFLIQLFEILTRFETRNGVLSILTYAKHQIGLSTIAFAAAMIAAASGCVHYCISILNPAAYSRTLSAVDGLYFSVTTFATVGYGDIYPRSTAAKLACIGEISTGCLVLIFSANIALTVWLQRFSDVKPPPIPPEKLNSGSPSLNDN